MNRAALVTGASSGIGRALALGLARRGFDVVVAGRDEKRLEESARECRALGRVAMTVVVDLSRPDGVDALAAALLKKKVEVSVLVNNAGFTVHGAFSETPLELERSMVELHIGAMIGLTKLLLPGMLKRGNGRILNVGSVYAMSPVEGQAVYGATKAFMVSFTQSLAEELRGGGVTATALCPGVTRTELRARAGVIDNKRVSGMTAEAVAEAGLDGLMAGRRLVVTGAHNKAFVAFARFFGPRAAAALVRRVNRFRGLGATKR